MASEQIILDPSELATGRTTLDITPWLGPDGIDWGDAEVSAYMAEQARGEAPVDYRVPNRQVSGGLIFKGSIGGTTAVAARANIQNKIALLQREGGWVKRITAGGGTVYADVVNGTFRATSVAGWQSRDSVDTDASFSLECIPEFYEAETTDSDNSTTTQRELLTTTVMTAQGDNPNRVRMVVDNDGSTDWRGLIWCFRSKNYPGSTAATRNTGSASMVYEAESLGTLDTATKTAGTAIYGTATNGQWSGGTIVHHGTLSTNWTPVLSGRIGGTTYPTHTGTYQMFAILASTSGTAVRARSVWDVGDLVNPTENAAYRLPGANNRYFADLGEVRLDNSGLGTYRWDWQIQGAGDAGAETLSVDKVYIVNKDEGMGRLSAPISTSPGGFTGYTARSEFNTESGNISGDSLAQGGTWSTAGGTAIYTAAAGVATRTATTDSGTVQAGGFAIAGSSTYTASVVKVDVKTSALTQGHGVFSRYTDTNNFILAYWNHLAATFQVYVYVAGTPTTFGVVTSGLSINTTYTIQLAVSTSGLFLATLTSQGSSSPLFTCAGWQSALATGGALASGKAGMWDFGGAAGTRTYDNFAAWAPTNDAVAFNGQSAQLTTDGIIREDSGGTAYGPVSSVVGDLPRFPVPQQSGGTVEALLVPSIGDLEILPDTMGTASISAQNVRRPSWLFVDDS